MKLRISVRMIVMVIGFMVMMMCCGVIIILLKIFSGNV